MKATSLPVVIAACGAALLVWRIGGAIGAEIACDWTADGGDTPWFIYALLVACAFVPGTMLFAVPGIRERSDRRNARRLAMASAVGSFFFLPALLQLLGERGNAAPTLYWAIVAFLGYRFLFLPAAVPAGQHGP